MGPGAALYVVALLLLLLPVPAEEGGGGGTGPLLVLCWGKESVGLFLKRREDQKRREEWVSSRDKTNQFVDDLEIQIPTETCLDVQLEHIVQIHALLPEASCAAAFLLPVESFGWRHG